MPDSRPVDVQYIRAIDGLRTVAVLIVLLFHVKLNWATGGFVGVDVFFVISGFLITRIILRDILGQRFSAIRFFSRRFARLFPALFVVILLTLLAGSFILGPAEVERLGRVSLLAVVSLGNVFFLSEAGYFDVAASSKPLLHTWSLAVEEQFYLLWPLLLLAIVKLNKRFVLGALVGLTFMSAGSSYIASQFYPSATFFMMPMRIFQFAIGGVVALVPLARASIWSSLGTLLALLVLLALMMLIDGTSPYLLSAITPAIAGAVLIFCAESNLSSRLLGGRTLSWVGQRSYSIYLVHWPLIVLYAAETGPELSAIEQVVLLVMSIGLGALLYTQVESRFRPARGQTEIFQRRVLGGVSFFAIGIMFAGAHFWALNLNNDQETLLSGADPWSVRRVAARQDICNFVIGDIDPESFDVSICSEPSRARPSHLIVGDSFATDAYLFLKEAFPDDYFGQVTMPGCLLRPPNQITELRFQKCRQLYERALFELALDDRYDSIILSSNWEHRHYYRIDELIALLENTGLEVVVIGARARFPKNVSLMLDQVQGVDAFGQPVVQLTGTIEETINDTIIERFSTKAKVLDVFSAQCDPEGNCPVQSYYGDVLYLDDSHLSMQGVKFVATKIKESDFTLNGKD